MSTKLGEHEFQFDKKNIGESLWFITEYFDNGDRPKPAIFTNQHIKFQGCENDVTINLHGIEITVADLRQLANELEMFESTLKCK